VRAEFFNLRLQYFGRGVAAINDEVVKALSGAIQSESKIVTERNPD
jgi:hypothetical protein